MFFTEGWALKPLAVNKSINLGPQTVMRIDLVQKICICDVIDMAMYLQCDVIKAPSVHTRFVYFLVSVQPLSTNFGSNPGT